MKKLMFTLCLIVGGLVAVMAQDTTSTDRQDQQQYPTSKEEDQDREKINSRDLPDAVKRSLEGTEYRGWLVNAVYKSKGVEASDSTNISNQDTQNQSDTTAVSGQEQTGAYGQEVFVVELKNGAQTKTVRFYKDGKKLDDPAMKDDQK
jgi:hypothetical protein